ncbi:MAG: response regulator [Deltaproteobacteria bacterium]|nr:response regulator [Deltaproteobacteria bacterium]
MVRQLLTFSRSQEVTRQCIDLGEVVANLEDMLARLLGEDVSLTVEVESKSAIFANLNQIEQVVINLATNARDALPKGGNIKITVGLSPATDDDSSCVVLQVHDDGEGMREDIRSRVFEPFFTTKPTGHGTGLGLAMVYGFMQSAGGEAEAESEIGVGTTLTLRFPYAGNMIPVPIEKEEKELVRDDNNAECILLVEDDESVARVTQQFLTAAGFEVRIAPHGEAALEMLETGSTKDFQLVISDVVMPRLGGPDLIRAMRARGDERPVILISGYTASSLQGLKELDETFTVVEKPFAASELVAEIRATLDALKVS